MGHDDVGGKPCQRVCHVFIVGATCPHPIAPVMARGWPQI
jgi:hypothetical protein